MFTPSFKPILAHWSAKLIRFAQILIMTLLPGATVCFHARVPRLRSFLKYWLPVLLWIALIYSASADRKSAHHSSRFIEPIIRRLLPNLSDKSVQAIVYRVRKCAHLTEYAILALVVWRALRRSAKDAPWRWRDAALALAFVASYAITDEWHQTFVPDRQGSIADVILDVCGGAAALLLLYAAGRVTKRWGRQKPGGTLPETDS
jgi:VanZ family protein